MTHMNKTEIIKKLEDVKEHALAFLSAEHIRWKKNDPAGFAEANVRAAMILEGASIILDEIEFLPENAQFEYLNKGEFERYHAISNLLRREDTKNMTSKWRELFGNIENMNTLYNEVAFKMGELSIYEAPPVYIIYTEKITSLKKK